MLNKVGIIGVAQSHFGEESEKSLEELIFQTCHEALTDAGITIDGVPGKGTGYPAPSPQTRT